jgi:serine/threonine-protein kinase
MSLTIGTLLGFHEITALLGKGGMGEVYRARDTKLKREVAIKILPDEFSRDAARVSRFQREAEVLAALNHPNIASIYDLQEAAEMRFLVLELVEGETLAERIQRGRIPVEEAIEIARHICEALEAAHEKGIVHRDLKPANVKITSDARVKVLDFGLAKAMENTAVSGTLSNSPTLSLAATQAGVILGTAAYMSPEQAKGFEVDARSDTFSFGSVFFEMLTGRQAFHGDTVAEVLASVLVREPDFSLLPANLNLRIQELLQRCLQKNPKRRWQAVGDIRAELETIAAAPHATPAAGHTVVARPLWKRAIPVVAAAVVFTIVGVISDWKLRPAVPGPVVRFTIPLSLNVDRAASRSLVAVSPDGTKLAYAGNEQILVRQMSDTEARAIPAAAGGIEPFFSPDGQWLGFFSTADSTLKKVALTGGAAISLCKLAGAPVGISWDGDAIVLGSLSQGILRVPENGGEPQTLVARKQEEEIVNPQLLDNGRAVLYSSLSSIDRNTPDAWAQGEIVIQSLASGQRKVLVRGGYNAHYLPSGHLVYALRGTILAVPFDLKKMELKGGATSVVERVMEASGLAQAAISSSGALVYVPGGEPGSTHNVVTLVDHDGKAQPLPLPSATYFDPRISPDGKQVAVETDDGKETLISIYDLSGQTNPRRLTFGGNNRTPVWSRDGRYIFFRSDREGAVGIFRQLADGTGPAERLTKAETGDSRHFPFSVDPLSRVLSFEVRFGTDSDIWLLALDGSNKVTPFLQQPKFQAHAAFSPDGRWLAYMSNEIAVRPEIFVQPYPSSGSAETRSKYQITRDGGGEPLWSPDGKRLYYVWTSKLYAVDIRTEPTFSFGKPTPLPITLIQGTGNPRNYDITPSGKQFVVVMADTPRDGSPPPGTQINVVLNWVEELTQRVPVK